MKKTLVGLSIIAALSPALASAEGDYKDGYTGGYIGAAYGKTELDVDAEDKAAIESMGATLDDTDTGFKLFGGYRINKHFAIEAFYADFGEATIELDSYKATSEADTLGGAVVGIIPISNSFELFGKFGFQAWDAEFKDNEGNSLDDDGTDPMFGAGLAFTKKQVSLRVEFERYNLDEEDVDMMSVGITYKF